MATLRLTLFDSSFEVLDRIDLVIQGKEKHGAGQAIQAIKSFLWENHFSADLDPILATRQNLLARLDALAADVELLKKWESQTDLIRLVQRIDLKSVNAAIQEARMMNDLSLPEKYKQELEARFGRKKDGDES
jgi:hypothetical protein